MQRNGSSQLPTVTADPQRTRIADGAHYDVVILGGGLAGLSLARHLLLETDQRILLLERRGELPPPRQKVGESSVQLGGYYFSRVLDMEQHLLHEHFLKYNLRFYWRSPDRDNTRFEDYNQCYIRNFSNIASYQLDRNVFEAELLRCNLESERFTLGLQALGLEVDLADDGGRHTVRFEHAGRSLTVRATWVVDTTGRRQLLAKERQLTRPNSIRHGSFFWWVEGLVDVERLTDLSLRERRLRPERRFRGHTPSWLATNHFADEGLWFWVIPLRGKTSLGLVFDKAVVDHREVFTVEKATAWICQRFPLFARDLPQRKVLDFGGYQDFSYDCAQTIDPRRWAMTGEAGRFSDPLYSPGSDLIAIHNTLIVDAIRTANSEQLPSRCALYENLMRGVYAAYEPGYALTYNTLGDQEAFVLKYVWELTVYFAYYVFPFINDLFTDRRFALAFLRRFSQLGPINRGVQRLLSGFYQWKREQIAAGELQPPAGPTFFDFMELAPLRKAEQCFYRVGVSVEEAKQVLGEQLSNLEEMARFIAAHIGATVAGDPRLVKSRAFVESFDLNNLQFDAEDLRQRAAASAGGSEMVAWSLDPCVMDRFRCTRKGMPEAMPAAAMEVA